MRDPQRLEDFYSELKVIHQRSFCDWRFLQFMYNFLGWVHSEKKTDGWYYEEDSTLKLLKEYESIYGVKEK
jgi:hypothetical protein